MSSGVVVFSYALGTDPHVDMPLSALVTFSLSNPSRTVDLIDPYATLAAQASLGDSGVLLISTEAVSDPC